MERIHRLYGIILFLTLLSGSLLLSAQSPGGVSSNLNLWLKADAGTSSTTDGADVLTWTDQSLNGIVGTTTFFSTKPSYAASGINFNPAIEFDGIGAAYNLPFGTFPSNDNNYCIYAIIRSDLNSGPQIITNTGATDDWNVLMTYVNTDGSIADDAMGHTEINLSPPGTISDNPGLVSFHYNISTNTSVIYVNGIAVSTLTSIPDRLIANGPDLIGTTYINSGFTFQDYFDGYIAELIHYPSPQSTTDQLQVNSYLALKYGITLGSGSDLLDYLASDGSVIWTGNATYQNDIGGIGRDDGSALNQKQSKSINDDAILSLGLGTIASTNNGNPNTFAADLSFLLWGNDKGNLTVSASELPAGVDTRLGCEWRVAETGSTGMLAVEFDLSGIGHSGSGSADFELLIDEDGDGDFTSGTIRRISASAFSSNVVTFTGVDLADSEIFTLGITPIVSPGAVSTPLQVWYKADAGVTGSPVTNWQDQSSNKYHLDGTLGPDKLDNQINFHPALYFDGVTEYLKVDDGILRSGTFNDITVFVVNRTDVVLARVIFEQMFSGSRKIGANIPWDNSRAYFNIGLNGSNTLAVDWSSVNGQPALWAHCSSTGTTTLTGFEKSTHLNGLEMGTVSGRNSGLTGELTPFYLGAKNASQRRYNGDISELIIFTGTMTALEFQRTNSYLAIKYGLTLSDNTDNDGNSFESPNADGNYEGDYLSSDGTAVWDASVNQAYHNDVAGIGLDFLSGLNQKQSQSSNGDIVAMGLGEIASNHANNSYNFSVDESYLLWGHNSDGLTEISSELPAGISHRLQREWRVQETGTIGGIVLNFELSGLSLSGSLAVEFKLLIDEDGDGNFTTGSIRQINPGSLVNNTLTFTNVDYATSECFTLGVIPNLSPYITSTPPDSVEINDTYTYNVTSADPENDSRAFSALSIPAWLSFTDHGDGTGTLTGSPSCADLGDHTIVLNVSDGVRDSTQSYVLTVWGSDTEDPVISGSQAVCTPVQENYSVTDPGDHSFLWTTTNGTIVGSAVAPSVVVEWTGTTQGSLGVTVTSNSGCINNDSIVVDKYATPDAGNIASDLILIER